MSREVLKSLLSVIFNSEAYQYAYNPKNNFDVDEYRAQGAKLKRMSAQQLNDSLKTIRYGNLDKFAKNDSEYFEFEDRLNELAMEYKNEFLPKFNKLYKQYRNQKEPIIDDAIVTSMMKYMEKYKEAEEYYQVLPSGYIKGKEPLEITAKGLNPRSRGDKKKLDQLMANSDKMGNTMMGSMSHGPVVRKGTVMRANRSSSDFMQVFGALDRSAPESTVETGATMKQILKMMNSRDVKKSLLR